MNIKSVSVATGLPVKTIRYYEDVGLVRPAREPNGYRVFSEKVAWFPGGKLPQFAGAL